MYKCELCDKEFVSKSGLLKHLNIHNNIQEKLTCDICDKKLSYSKLRRHKKTHDESWVEVCDICKKTIRKRNIKEHVKRHDKNRKLLKCEACDKEFSTKSNLVDHSKTHNNTQEK